MRRNFSGRVKPIHRLGVRVIYPGRERMTGIIKMIGLRYG
jgi:hypothetical protein